MESLESLIAPTFAREHAMAAHRDGEHALAPAWPGDCEACDARYSRLYARPHDARLCQQCAEDEYR